MDNIHIIILGLVQGITEFLPISSSAHLILVPHLLGYDDQGIGYDVAAHAGTLGAVLLFCLPFIKEMALSCIYYKNETYKNGRHLLVLLIIATLPIVVIGFLLHDVVATFLRTPFVIAIASLGGAFLLLYIHYKKPKNDIVLYDLSYKQALYIGLWQVLALIPGASRAAVSIMGARVMGLSYTQSLNFSFLLAVPTIMGAIILEADMYFNALMAGEYAMFLVMMVSFISAFAVLFLFKKFIDVIGLMPFIIYRLLLSITILSIIL